MFGVFKKKVHHVDNSDEASEADIKSAHFIQQKCQICSIWARADDDSARKRYRRNRDEMIGLLDGIDDDFCRGFATHQVIKLCMDAKEDFLARALLVSVRDNLIREKILEDFPQLLIKPVSRNSIT